MRSPGLWRVFTGPTLFSIRESKSAKRRLEFIVHVKYGTERSASGSALWALASYWSPGGEDIYALYRTVICMYENKKSVRDTGMFTRVLFWVPTCQCHVTARSRPRPGRGGRPSCPPHNS